MSKRIFQKFWLKNLIFQYLVLIIIYVKFFFNKFAVSKYLNPIFLITCFVGNYDAVKALQIESKPWIMR